MQQEVESYKQSSPLNMGRNSDGGHLVPEFRTGAGQTAATGAFTGGSSNSAHQRCTLLKHGWMQQFNWKD